MRLETDSCVLLQHAFWLAIAMISARWGSGGTGTDAVLRATVEAANSRWMR